MTPALDEAVTVVAAVASNVTILLLAFTILFLHAAAKARWRHAYALLVAGPALFGALVLLHLRYPVPLGPADGLLPATASLPFPDGLASIAAALGVSLAVLGAWASRATLPACVAWSAAAVAWGIAPVLAGTTSVENALAGAGLGMVAAVSGIIAGRMLNALLAPDGVLPSRLQPACSRFTSWADRRLMHAIPLLLTLIGLGILLRVPGWFTWSIGPDASRYAAMADALNRHGEFLMPWGDIYSPGSGPQFSHHFPPLYPAILALFYKVLGFSEATTRLASLLLAVLAIAVTYWCTKDLYGRTKGLVAAAVVSLSPVLVMTTNKAYAENLLLVLFVLAMWAILKSLDRPWFIVLGAVFAGLGYLTKSSMGYFFIVAGLGGLAWRLHWKGWKAVRDPAYVTAIVIFGAMVAAWATRNVRHFGEWSTSTHLDAAYATAFGHPLAWANLLVYSFLVMFGLGYLLYMAVLVWLPTLRRIPRLESEHDSGLWLAVGLPVVLTIAIDAALWLYEGTFFLHNVRYVSFVIVPLAWLIMRHVGPAGSGKIAKQTWAAIVLTFAILIAGSVYYAAVPNRPLNTEVAREFGALVQDGDSITFVADNDVYRYYFAVTKDGTEMDHLVLYQPELMGAEQTDWLVIRGPAEPWGGYGKVLDRSQGAGLLAERFTVWQRLATPS